MSDNPEFSSSEVDIVYQTKDLFDAIEALLEEMEVAADISFAVCDEVVIHFHRDIERLFAVHHKYLHPSKAASYLAFWIRKLKPVSAAFTIADIEGAEQLEDLDLSREISDINEQVAIHISMRMLDAAIADEAIEAPKGIDRSRFLNQFRASVEEYFSGSDVDELHIGSRFHSIIYDMRFRTFGPHHLTNMLTHVLREVYISCKK